MICSLCEQDKAQLFYIRMRVGPIIDIMPQVQDKPGMCQNCLQFCGKKLSKSRSYAKLGSGKFYLAPGASSGKTVGERLEADLLKGLVAEQEERSPQPHLLQPPALPTSEEQLESPAPI